MAFARSGTRTRRDRDALRWRLDRLVSIEGRFTKPVFPGDAIATKIWKMGQGEAYFSSEVPARSEAVITLGRVVFRE